MTENVTREGLDRIGQDTARWVLILLACSGCTLLSDFGIHQCASTADCDTLGDGVRRCEDFRCVEGCESNHHCAAFDPRAPICPAPGAACARLIDVDESCYLSSTYDDATMGSLTGEGLNIVGAFAPRVTSSTWLTLQLAADELNAYLPLATDPLAPTLVVLCDGSPLDIANSVEHLEGRLQVRALVGSVSDVSLRAALDAAKSSSEPLWLSPNPASAGAAREVSDLVWYLGGRYSDLAQAYGPLLHGAIRTLERRATAPESFRIASLVSEASEDAELSGSVTALIDASGRNADYLFREDRFRQFVLSDTQPEVRARTLQSLGTYAPDLVLVFTSGTFLSPAGESRFAAISTLETLAASNPDWRPLYLFGQSAVSDSSLAQLAASNESFRARAIGISSDRAPEPSSPTGEPQASLAAAMTARFHAAFPEAASHGLGPSFLTYDVFYYLAYALAAAQRGTEGGSKEALLDGFARELEYDESCVDVGPNGMATAFRHITGAEPFQLCGMTGPARFATDHARRAERWLFCWSPAAVAADTGAVVQTIADPFAMDASMASPPCAGAYFAQGLPP